jgi:hypothetical protein
MVKHNDLDSFGAHYCGIVRIFSNILLSKNGERAISVKNEWSNQWDGKSVYYNVWKGKIWRWNVDAKEVISGHLFMVFLIRSCLDYVNIVFEMKFIVEN